MCAMSLAERTNFVAPDEKAVTKMVYIITVEGSGPQFPCTESECVLAAMKRAGQGPLHYGCFGGGCGICKMQIVSGEYHVAKRMSRAHISETEQAEGILLMCCVEPRGDLILKIIDKD